MSNLLTNHPIALQYLMNETLFNIDSDEVKEVSGFVVAEKKQIQTPSVVAENTTVNTQEEFIYKGSKEKGVIFILRYPEYDYFSPGAYDAFEKIINAIGMDEREVAVMNLANAHNPNEFKRIMTFFQPKKITLLGVEPASLALPAIPHNSYMRGKVATVFNTYSFEEMFVDQEKKKAFWLEFKKFMVE